MNEQTPTPAAFRVSVTAMRASNGTTYVVCLDRTDRGLNAMAWHKGRITPINRNSLEEANDEGAHWARFFGVPFVACEPVEGRLPNTVPEYGTPCGNGAIHPVAAGKAEPFDKSAWTDAVWAAMRGLCLMDDAAVRPMNIHTIRLFCDASWDAFSKAGGLPSNSPPVAAEEAEPVAQAADHTGLDPEMGFILEGANAGELAAYEFGCDGMMASLKAILDGKDHGHGANHEPWGTLRRRVLALVAQAADQKDAARLDWLEQNLFDRNWGGTLGRACSWSMVGPYRHTMQLMRGDTLRAAIDAALSRGLS